MEDQERLTKALADRYRVEREIGSGGMATVYLADDVKHERKVALKVLRPELAAALGRERFLQEIAIAARLNHPNILPLHDSGEADGFLYYLMPFIEGESLRERLQREGKLSIPEAIRLTDQVASALTHAHERGLVHRDIKPSNLMLDADGTLKIVDFGLARVADGDPAMTLSGDLLGTPAYMSPEQADASAVDIDTRSDIYALGVLLYELASGRRPFGGDSLPELMSSILRDDPPPLLERRPDLPKDLDRVIRHCLEKDPERRMQSAAALRDELAARGEAT